jgi:hypothetical protein
VNTKRGKKERGDERIFGGGGGGVVVESIAKSILLPDLCHLEQQGMDFLPAVLSSTDLPSGFCSGIIRYDFKYY